MFIGRTDDEAPILWPPDVKRQLIGKDPDAGKDWGQDEKGATEEEMVGWHHPLNGHEFEQTPWDNEGEGSLWSQSRTWLSDWTTTYIKPNEKLLISFQQIFSCLYSFLPLDVSILKVELSSLYLWHLAASRTQCLIEMPYIHHSICVPSFFSPL